MLSTAIVGMSSTLSSPEPSSGTDGPTIDRDETFHILRNRRRRYALHTLKSHEGGVEIGDVAEQVAAWEYDVDRAALTAQQRKRVYNSLQQTHLPELDEAGLIEYERGTAELTERADELDVYLEVVPEQETPWSKYYLALGAVCSSLAVAVWFSVPGLAGLSGFDVATMANVAFLFSAVVHVAAQRNARLSNCEEPPEVRDK
jgi:hypothetical protein